MASHASLGQSLRSSISISASTWASSSGLSVALRRSRIRSPALGRISATVLDSPTASAATSALAGLPRYQAARRPSRSSHSLASVVFPYPAGATSRMIRAPLSSSMRVSRGRSMIRRRLAPTAGVASCTAIPPSHTVTRFPPICEELPVPAARAAGTGPSVPGSGPGSEAFQERVFAREQSEGDWNLPASCDTELLAQDVTVRLGRPR